MQMRSRAVIVLSVLITAALAGCAAPAAELDNDEWACVHFAAVNEKLAINYLDTSVEAANKWDDARAALDETEEMASGDLPELIGQAHEALPASPIGDVTEFNRVVTEIDAACELPGAGFDIRQLLP